MPSDSVKLSIGRVPLRRTNTSPPDLYTLKELPPEGRAEFYVRSPFRRILFWFTTSACAGGLLLCGGVIALSIRKADLLSLILSVFVIIGLIGTWSIGYHSHRVIRQLLAGGEIQRPEPNSALDKILEVNSRLVQIGLLFAFCTVELALLLVLTMFGR